MQPGAIRMLPKWHALLLYRNFAPVITKITPVWERADYKAAMRNAAARIAPAGPPPPDRANAADRGCGGDW